MIDKMMDLLMEMENQKEALKKELIGREELIANICKKFGRMFEKFAPFTENFPGDKDKTIFCGPYVDFICFDEDTIKFVEIKTGKSRLTKNQQRIKNQIERGQIEYKEVRY